MKKRILAGVLTASLCMTLSGCAAMLERSYHASAQHIDRLAVAEDSSVLRVENYRELVSAVLYLVSQGAEEGVIQLHDYTGEVETDLPAACLEVANEDPLGAYAVDYIKHEYTRVVSYYQATLNIHYRRTLEQVRSMVNVTGTGAIRTELQEALARFDPEVVLRVAYFAEDEQSIAQLIRQAYYDTPAAALGMPQAQISLYPDEGSQRVVEIQLTYPEGEEELRAKSRELSDQVDAITAAYWDLEGETLAQRAARELARRVSYSAQGGSTAYDAFTAGEADSQGMALAYVMLCGRTTVDCEVVEGEREGEPWFWNRVQFFGEEQRYLDPTQGDSRLRTARELFEEGYRWPGGPQEPEEAVQVQAETVDPM